MEMSLNLSSTHAHLPSPLTRLWEIDAIGKCVGICFFFILELFFLHSVLSSKKFSGILEHSIIFMKTVCKFLLVFVYILLCSREIWIFTTETFFRGDVEKRSI